MLCGVPYPLNLSSESPLKHLNSPISAYIVSFNVDNAFLPIHAQPPTPDGTVAQWAMIEHIPAP